MLGYVRGNGYRLYPVCIAGRALPLFWQEFRRNRERSPLPHVAEFFCSPTDMHGPASLFFLLLTVIVVAWAVVLIVGHLVWGQKF